MSDKCKERVWHHFCNSQCSRNAVKDGYCKQHHPDSVAKRKKESEERLRRSPYARLERATLEIKELEHKLNQQSTLLDEAREVIEECEFQLNGAIEYAEDELDEDDIEVLRELCQRARNLLAKMEGK